MDETESARVGVDICHNACVAHMAVGFASLPEDQVAALQFLGVGYAAAFGVLGRLPPGSSMPNCK